MLKQTKGAITLLIQAYSSVLTNSFTASRKNSGSNHHTARTAAALILSVLMAGTAATAYAETTIKETVEATEDLKDYKGGDLTIEAKEDDEEDEGIHAKKSSIKIDVTAKDGEAGDLIIKGKTHGISSKVQDSEGYVTIKATGDITIEYKDGDGINIDRTNQAEVSITAGGSNTIKALSSKKGDGIKINKGKSGDITLVAEGSGDGAGNIIEAGNNGIDHNGAQTLTLKAEHGINKITARNGDAVRADGGGTVILNLKSAKHTTDKFSVGSYTFG